MKLVADNLSAERGGELIIADVSFTVEGGGALVITGPNGVGKSTLLRVIAGLLPMTPLPGKTPPILSLKSDDPEYTDAPIAESCHYLGHENALKPTLTVMENLSFWQQHFDHPAMDIEDALEEVDLAGIGHLPFGHLSTGQRRRVAICRLMINSRPLWLLDEPTSGLDASSEKRFTQIMRDHLEDGGMIIAATHLPLGLDSSHTLQLTVPDFRHDEELLK